MPEQGRFVHHQRLSQEYVQIGKWSWNSKAYINMVDATAKTFMENAEGRTVPTVDDDLQVTFDTGDVNDDAARKAVTFSRKLHYLLTFSPTVLRHGDFCIRSLLSSVRYEIQSGHF